MPEGLVQRCPMKEHGDENENAAAKEVKDSIERKYACGDHLVIKDEVKNEESSCHEELGQMKKMLESDIEDEQQSCGTAKSVRAQEMRYFEKGERGVESIRDGCRQRGEIP